MKHSVIILILEFLSCLSLQAVQIRVLAWDEDIVQRKLAISYGKKSITIEKMSRSKRSKPIKVPNKSESLALAVNDRLSEEGTPLMIPLSIKEEIKDALLLILPDKKSPTGLKTIIINDNIADFKWGTLRFMNLTNKELVFRHHKKNVLIPTGWKPATVTPEVTTKNMAVSLYLRENPKTGQLYSSLWEHQKNYRKLIFIVPSNDKERGPVDFKFINEHISAYQTISNPQ